MVSNDTESSLVKILLALAEGERTIEISRQVLSDNFDFDAFQIFKVLDKESKNKIDSNNILDFLKKKEIDATQDEAKLIIFFYDQDCDDALSYVEYINLVQSEKSLKKTNLSKTDKLSFNIEYSLTKILEKEIKFCRGLIVLLNNLRSRFDYNIHDMFHLLKGFNTITYDSIKKFLQKNGQSCLESDIKSIIKRLDLNKDGRVDIGELHSFLGFPKCRRVCPCKSSCGCNNVCCSCCCGCTEIIRHSINCPNSPSNLNNANNLSRLSQSVEAYNNNNIARTGYDDNNNYNYVNDNSEYGNMMVSHSVPNYNYMSGYNMGGEYSDVNNNNNYNNSMQLVPESDNPNRSTRLMGSTRMGSKGAYNESRTGGFTQEAVNSVPLSNAMNSQMSITMTSPIMKSAMSNQLASTMNPPLGNTMGAAMNSQMGNTMSPAMNAMNTPMGGTMSNTKNFQMSNTMGPSMNVAMSSTYNNSFNQNKTYMPYNRNLNLNINVNDDQNEYSNTKVQKVSDNLSLRLSPKRKFFPVDQLYQTNEFNQNEQNDQNDPNSQSNTVPSSIIQAKTLFLDHLRILLEAESKIEKAKIDLASKVDFNIEEAFRIFEYNFRGYLTFDDIKLGFNSLGIDASNLEINLFLKRFDLLNENQIEFEDFFDMIAPFEGEYRQMLENKPPNSNKIIKSPDCFMPSTKICFKNLLTLLIDYESKFNTIKGNYALLRYKLNEVFEEIVACGKDYPKNFFTEQDLVEYFKRNNFQADNKDIDLLFIRLDRNRNGQIDYQEIENEISATYE